MTTEVVLRLDIDPASEASAGIRNSIVPTDANGVAVSNLSDIRFIYFCLPPGGLPLVTYVMNKIQSKLCLHSNSKGFAIFSKNGAVEHSIGNANSWSRVPVTLDSGLPSNLIDGMYVMDLE